MGPILIFDKSTLESLNPDEAGWMDNFFLSNITPLFFIETLADLEKQVRSGRTPEQVVGNLAYKTPDMNSYPNVHHRTLLAGELSGRGVIDMLHGRPMIAGGQQMELEGRTGIIFKKSPEAEALHRWQKKEFLELERITAKAWRKSLSYINFDEYYTLFQGYFQGQKPKTLAEVKSFTESIIDGSNRDVVFEAGLTLLGFGERSRKLVLARWQSGGKPALSEFAPYFRYVFSVDLFFYLAIASDLISRGRPSHKVDLAYLYYLPFSMVFTSNDHLHASIVPFFLRANQTFVNGMELKADLAKLDQHYSALPNDIKDRGIYHFANYPPIESSFLVSRLWDKHMSSWRNNQAKHRPTGKIDVPDDLLEKIKRFGKEAVPSDPSTLVSSDDADHVVIERSVYARKGKWKRFSPEVEKSSTNQN